MILGINRVGIYVFVCTIFCAFLTMFSIPNKGQSHIDEDPLEEPGLLQGYWRCKENGGVTRIVSYDSVELEIASNQIWILGRLKKYNDSVFEVFLVNPLDLGRGGMSLDWEHFSCDEPIARISILDEHRLIKHWIGFYNKANKKHEKKWAIDWDACDTLFRLK